MTTRLVLAFALGLAAASCAWCLVFLDEVRQRLGVAVRPRLSRRLRARLRRCRCRSYHRRIGAHADGCPRYRP